MGFSIASRDAAAALRGVSERPSCVVVVEFCVLRFEMNGVVAKILGMEGCGDGFWVCLVCLVCSGCGFLFLLACCWVRGFWNVAECCGGFAGFVVDDFKCQMVVALVCVVG